MTRRATDPAISVRLPSVAGAVRFDRLSFTKTSLLMTIGMVLAGCAVGPNYTKPEPPDTQSYLRDDTLGRPLRLQNLPHDSTVAPEWWNGFQSPSLDSLIKESVANSPTLDAADAAIRVAQFNALAQRGLFLPQVAASTSPSSQLLSNNTSLPPTSQIGYSLYTHSLTVSFVPDVWGGNFRAVENLDAVAEQQFFQLQAAHLTLTSNIAAAAIQEASLRGQIDATRRIIAIERNLLEILRRQYNLGQIARADVVAQEAALAVVEQSLPPLQKQLAQQRDLLTALAGRNSADEVSQKFELSQFKLPRNIPIVLPAQLVERRPDIQAAAANLHAASALVGVAVAARLPNITVAANGGSSAYKLAESFLPGTNFYTVAATATQPIFDGLTLYHKQKAAEAALDQAKSQYRSTVIVALQNVADALRALQFDAAAIRAAIKAEDAAKTSLDIVEQQLKAGQVNQLAVLNAQQTLLTAAINRVQAQANRLADTVALFMALGGGWPRDCGSSDWRRCIGNDEQDRL